MRQIDEGNLKQLQHGLGRNVLLLVAWLAFLLLPLLLSVDPEERVVPLGQGGFALPSTCLFHAATGVQCPLCGLTRSLVSLGHLRWRESLHFNPVGPLVYLAAALRAIRHLLRLFARTYRPQPNSKRGIARDTFVIAMILVVVWLGRFLANDLA